MNAQDASRQPFPKPTRVIEHFATVNGNVHTREFMDGRQVGSSIYSASQWNRILALGMDAYVCLEPHPIAERSA